MTVVFPFRAQAAAGLVPNYVLAGIVVAALAAIVLRAMSCQDSRTRFAVWFSTLLAIAGLSFASCVPVPGLVGSSSTPYFTLPADWSVYAFLAWVAIVSIGLLRVFVGLLRIWSLRRRCEDVPQSLLDGQLLERLRGTRFNRQVKVRVSDDLRVPAAVGFVSPAVVLPRWAMKELSRPELNAVVLHELGHLRRWDDWTNLIQKIVRALLFFHPAVWWIDARLTLEREIACDDFVLANSSGAREYAECLVSVAEKSLFRSGTALALAAVSHMRQMMVRLSRILDRDRVAETRVSKPTLAAVAGVSVVAMAMLPHAPALIGFQTSPAAPQVSQRQNIPNVEMPALKPLLVKAEADEAPLGRAPEILAKHSGRTKFHSGATINPSRSRRVTTLARASASGAAARPVLASGHADDQSTTTLVLIVNSYQEPATGVSVWNVQVWRVSLVEGQRSLQAGELVAKKI